MTTTNPVSGVTKPVAEQKVDELVEAARKDAAAVLGILGAGYTDAASIIALLKHQMGDVDGQIEDLTKEIEGNTAASKAIQEKLTALRELEAAMSAAEKEAGKNVDLNDLKVGDMDAVDFIEQHGLGELLEYSNFPDAKFDKEVGKMFDESGELDLAQLQMLASEVGYSYGGYSTSVVPDYPYGDQILSYLSDEAKADGKITKEEYAEAFAAWQKAEAGNLRQLNRNSLTGTVEALQSEQRELNSFNEIRMIQLQSVMQQRSQVIQLSTNIIKSINDAQKAIVGNFR